jgi:hypothetical protein
LAVTIVRLSSLKQGDADEGQAELDNHADTTVLGSNTALIIHDFERPVRVHGYDSTVAQRDDCKTVSGVVAYDHPDGTVYYLVFHQAILIPQMTVSLISSMQLRDNDIMVNDEPKHMVLNPTNDHHCIMVNEAAGRSTTLCIPLLLHGITSYFPTRKPTREEYEQSDLDVRIDMTYESPEWDPSDERYAKAEASMINNDGSLRNEGSNRDREVNMTMISAITSCHERQCNSEFALAMKNNVRISLVKSVNSRKGLLAIGPTLLAKRWKIKLDAAKRTLRATTHSIVRTTLHPTLSRRFRTNDRQLRYRRIPHEVYTDTMKASTVSWFRQNKYAQVFCTRFGWTRVYPMRSKAEAHEGLTMMFQRDGVPLSIIMDGSKEQTMGEFLLEGACGRMPYQADGTIFSMAKRSRERYTRTEARGRAKDDRVKVPTTVVGSLY